VLLRTGLHMADEVITARCLAEAERMLCGASARARRIGAWSTAIAAASEGRHETALRSANPAYAALDAGDPPMLLVQSPLESVELARIALLGGNRTQAEIVLRDLRARHLASPSVAVLEAGCRHIEGLLNGDPLALRSAAALYASGSRILAQALAEEDAGALADTSGDAVAKFDAALEIYERAGATADAARVRARLRSHGVIRRARVSQDGAAGGLTRTEHAVVDLIVAGCSDREIAEKLFISAHTVRSHITHIFEKLDVGSRVEIVSRMERG
jgi:DNA-binding CsgD family transcriptional regulator